ncbi:hypothetical protein HNR37_001105 [Desulfurispira natronophila]|uniref:Uncharacterized protein n=1 Tax=Desulfurispira natronophila TaxID=682562 RepID=A0A7W7Y4S9_9BACT|nr:hypothetical protein [Desulfurispira natronophila]
MPGPGNPLPRISNRATPGTLYATRELITKPLANVEQRHSTTTTGNLLGAF